MSEATSMPDVAPIITVGTEWGKRVSEFRINISAITAHLRANGVSDERISQLKINYLNGPHPDESPGKILRGTYDRSTHTIDIALPDHLQRHVTPYQDDSFSEGYIKILRHYDKRMLSDLQGTTQHELEHVIIENDPKEMRKLKRFTSIWAAKNIGGVAVGAAPGFATYPLLTKALEMSQENALNISSVLVAAGVSIYALWHLRGGEQGLEDDLYAKRPDERRCRQAQEHPIKNLVTLTLR